MATYYIKTGGGTGTGLDDANAWSGAHFASIISGTSYNAGDSFLFKRGDTFFLQFTMGKSGTAENPMTIGAYGSGAKPVITGLQTLGAWTDIGGGLFEQTLSTFPTNPLTMVLVDGVNKPFGRWPKLSGTGLGGFANIDSHVGRPQVDAPPWTITSADLAGQPSFVGGELVMKKYQWIIDRADITDDTGNVLTYTPHVSPDHPSVTYEPFNNAGFFIQNHNSVLTITKEWAYNQTTKKITMHSPGAAVVRAAVLDYIIQITSKAYVIFDNISFEGANDYIFKGDSFTFIQITNCSFQYSGKNHLQVNGTAANTNHNEISGTTFLDCNSNALDLKQSTFWTITGNIISYCGMHPGMGLSGDSQYMGVARLGSDSLFELNEISYTGYNGLYFVGSNITINKNHVHHYLMVKADGGGIYTYSAGGTNRVISNNIVHDGPGNLFGTVVEGLRLLEEAFPFAGQVHGIYMDGSSEQVEIFGNTSFNNAHSGLWLGANHDIDAHHNTFYNNVISQIKGIGNDQPLDGILIDNNILFGTTQEQLIISFTIGSNYLATMGVINNNWYCRPIKEPQGINTQGYPNSPTLEDYPGGGIAEANVGAGARFYSLDTWKTLSGQDANTQKTFREIASPNEVRFDYNATNGVAVIPLTGTYKDVTGVVYSGNITLQPFSSKILIFQSLEVATILRRKRIIIAV